MISQIFDDNVFKVIALFALSPGSRFRRKEIQEKTKLNNVPLDKALSKIISAGIIKKEKNLYVLNFENRNAEQIINIASMQHKELKNILLDVYFLLIDLVSEFSIIKNIELWLFGSYSKLVYTEKSDIDIAIITENKLDKAMIRKILRKLEKQHEKEIEEHFFEKKSFYKNKKDPLVKEIIQNGIRLM